MYEIMMLSGQEYVDEYATGVKDQLDRKKKDSPPPPGRDATPTPASEEASTRVHP
jgi:hypothetical protein